VKKIGSFEQFRLHFITTNKANYLEAMSDKCDSFIAVRMPQYAQIFMMIARTSLRFLVVYWYKRLASDFAPYVQGNWRPCNAVKLRNRRETSKTCGL